MKQEKAVFLDRDDTLIKNVSYMNDPKDILFLDRVLPALRRLQDEEFKLIIITNQSGIGRGLVSLKKYAEIETALADQLAAKNIYITSSYHCPHHPKEARGDYLQACYCRKPKPGMIKTALNDHLICAEQSFMVGDRMSDVEAGQKAGVKGILLNGHHHALSDGIRPDFIAEDLFDAVVNFIIGR